MLYDYTLAPTADYTVFTEQCNVFIKNEMSVTQELIDVDGSVIRKYASNYREIEIWLDYEIGSVYMKSAKPCDDILFSKPFRIDTYL